MLEERVKDTKYSVGEDGFQHTDYKVDKHDLSLSLSSGCDLDYAHFSTLKLFNPFFPDAKGELALYSLIIYL